MANVSISGDVKDSVMVFGNNNYVVKIGDVNGGVVNIIKPSDKPKYLARPTPVTIKPRSFPSFLDRETELESIKKAVQISTPISVWGKEGIGKTAFIRHLTHTLNAESFSSGTIYLNVSGLEYEDLLQALFDAFFDSEPSYKPTTTEILHALQNIKALIFLDDLQTGQSKITSILDAVPNSMFLVSSTERSLWGEGEFIQLQGLPESEALRLFEKELSRSLIDQEKTTVIKICSMLQGHPLQILQAASLARENGRPVENLLTEISSEKSENKSMVYMSMAYLNESEKKILAILAAAGGNVVPLEHINGIFKDSNNQKELQRLVSLGLVQSHSPRFSIANTLVTSITSAWDITSWQDILLNHAIDWLGQQPASTLVEESSGLLVHILKTAGERKQWREVMQLGRALEKFMILYKRWQTWSDILNLILTAAKALNDTKIQAWALHQLGSRALYLGYASEAKTFLSQALNIRQAIGDKAGASITQHNINTLNGIIAPLKGNTSGCKKYLGYGCGGVAVMAILAVILWGVISLFQPIEPGYYPPTEAPVVISPTNSPSPTSTSTVTNTPTITATGTLPPTHTPTATPPPVLLYDFVEHANEAYWSNDIKGGSPTDLTFFYETPSPDPESYISESGKNYVGWDYEVALLNDKTYKQVLLSYPYYDYFKVFGDYEKVVIAQPAPNAYLELTSGYKNIFVESTTGVIFRVYINGKPVIEEPYKSGDKPINIGKEIRISKGTYTFRLEVETQSPSPYSYATWAVAKLWDKKP